VLFLRFEYPAEICTLQSTGEFMVEIENKLALLGPFALPRLQSPSEIFVVGIEKELDVAERTQLRQLDG
jgi:hypothetical protein